MKVMDKKSKYRSVRISGDVFFTILTIVVLFGAFVGSLYYREISAMDFVQTFSVVDYFYENGYAISFWKSFLCSLINNTLFIMAVFVSGTCMIGQPVCIAILLYKGICIGTSLAFAYSNDNITNFFVLFLHIILDAVVSTFVFVLASKEAIRFSNKFLKFVISNKFDDDFNKNMKLYLLKFAVLFVIIILLSLIQSIFLILIG